MVERVKTGCITLVKGVVKMSRMETKLHRNGFKEQQKEV